MTSPHRLAENQVDTWLRGHPGWAHAQGNAIAREFKFADFAEALAFVVAVGCDAQKSDHHPDVEVGWGRARILWTTHDAGGVTQRDLDAAAATDARFG
jgi:4a-hydroxytetrahydrobiopterin dehydratase